MWLLSLVGILGWLTAFGVMAWGTISALRHHSRKAIAAVRLPNIFPPITILKPVKGFDLDLELNLEGFFHLDYPQYELFFSIAHPDDPARATIEDLISRMPAIAARLFIGETRLGPNPKVNNLAEAYRRANYPTILISDSNVRVGPDYLRRLVLHLRPGVGLVTAVVAGNSPEGLGGYLEASYLNTFYARWMHIGAGFGFPMVVGKTMLFAKSTIERFGGMPTMAKYVAEDYMTGRAISRLGLKVVFAPEPIRQTIGRHRFRDFWSRHIRWGRIRKSHAPIAFFFEPVMGPVLSSSIAGLAAHGLFDTHVTFGFFPLLIWFALDLLLINRLENHLSLRSVATWVLREVLFFPLWCHIAAGRSVVWRGTRLRLRPGGLLEEKTEVIKERRNRWSVMNFFGGPPRAATRSTATMSTATGGTGKSRVTSKGNWARG